MESTSPSLARARERRVRVLDDHLDLAADEAKRVVRQQRAGQEAGLAQHLEAVADAEHGTAVAGELDHRLHQRREARDRAHAQVVAVREAAGDDHGVDAAQIAIAVPEQVGVARSGGTPSARRPRRRSPGSAPRRTSLPLAPVQLDHLVVLDQRVREEPLAHLRHLRRVLHVQLDQPPDVHVLTRRRSRAPAARARRPGPVGRGCPPSGESTHAPSSGALQPRLERLARDALVGVHVQLARARDHVIGQRRRGRASCPSRSRRPSRARTACRSSAGRGRARSRRRARSATSRA